MAGACVAGETATAADGTHPNGMHSCFSLIFVAVQCEHKTGFSGFSMNPSDVVC